MSTLDIPAIIARLHHGHDGYGKRGLSVRQQQLLSGYKSLKLPEIARHVGVGNRGGISLKNNDSFWKQPIYLDHVLRRHQQQGFDIKATYGSKHARTRQPKFLPKLDATLASGTGISAPFVQGQNVENVFDAGSGRSVSFLPSSDEDEDASWARNALNGRSSREIVRAYGITRKQFDRKFDARNKEVTFSNETALPPITKHEGDRDILRDRSPRNPMANDTAERNGNARKPKVTSVSFEYGSESAKEVPRSINVKNGLITHLSDQKTKSLSNPADVYNRAKPHEQSTFSRILHHESTPKTKAGKKLLSSLLVREGNEKQHAANQKRNAQLFRKPGVVLYSEEYLRLADALEQDMKNFRRVNGNLAEGDKKFGVGIKFDKLPAELVGHHFQQTYEHLWKYLMQNGKSHLAKSYFPSKKELQKTNPSTIYIPTGRLEETLCVERVDCPKNEEEQDNLKQVKLKYCHRHGEENNQSRDTSPWDIQEELKSPKQDKRKEVQNPSAALRETVVGYQSHEYANCADDGIRKLFITLPPIEAQAPPCTPVSARQDDGISVYHSCQKECGYCQPSSLESNANIELKKSDNVIGQQHYSAHVKVIDFQKVESSARKPKARTKKAVSRKGPIPTRQLAPDAPTSETKDTESTQTRVYSHGQYHVKVEKSVVRKRKPKLPKDMSNMFTKPYTFSYLTGVQAPCGLTSSLYSGNIANLASAKSTENVSNKTSLVSEIRKPELTEDQVDNEERVEGEEQSETVSYIRIVGIDKRDASTQYNAEEISEKLDTNFESISMAVVSPVLSAVHEHELRVSPTPVKQTVSHDKKNAATNEISNIRPLSEGAKENEINIYRSSVVKTYDASKFFRQTDPKLL